MIEKRIEYFLLFLIWSLNGVLNHFQYKIKIYYYYEVIFEVSGDLNVYGHKTCSF